VTGAIKRENLFEVLREEPEIFAVFSRVFALLARLLSGEEKNEKLFEYLEEAVKFTRGKKQRTELVRSFEYVLVLRILSCLGYLGSSPDTMSFVESPFWNDEILEKMNKCMPSVLGEINKSLKESQL
jgi:recombinational DNA repair protein (RecF pathway)